jgi:hypothetical protein
MAPRSMAYPATHMNAVIRPEAKLISGATLDGLSWHFGEGGASHNRPMLGNLAQ